MSILATTIFSWSPVEILGLCGAARIAACPPIASAAAISPARSLEAIRHRAPCTESGIAPRKNVGSALGVIEVEADAHAACERPSKTGAEHAHVVLAAESVDAFEAPQRAIAEPRICRPAGDVP